jgi:hypothetical protein
VDRIDLDTPQSSWSPMPQHAVGEVAEDAKTTRRAEVVQIVNALHEALPGELGRPAWSSMAWTRRDRPESSS